MSNGLVKEEYKRFQKSNIPYRAKLCRAKFSSGETIRRAKFSSPSQKFVTFARRKVSPDEKFRPKGFLSILLLLDYELQLK